ncbi:hypothetical protein FH972_008611 [Carpinus fangiana]|uniref:Uncharacterized protein n=1 Tax=Carpinus fangiana TaxID=176857 RepID=A0A5N6R1J2_9ROSI|nr:hypothetical protein FH972_008611 [Carpinus fangiana]
MKFVTRNNVFHRFRLGLEENFVSHVLIKSPLPKVKAHHVFKQKIGLPPQLVKHAFHIKPPFKWVMNSQAREAPTSGQDPVEEADLEVRDMSQVDLSSTQLYGPPVGLLAALDVLDAGVLDT